MEEHAIVYKQSYQEFKSELDHELNKAASGFVRIGWLLKQARDTDVLKDSPYENVTDFAEKEYGLDKSQVSRFMSIHDRFGDPDDPERLLEKYEGFGVKKLTMMLALPDAQNEELTPEYTAAEIQALKEEADEEKKVTPLEVMTEDKQEGTEDLDELETILYLIGQDNPEMMAELLQYEGFAVNPQGEKDLAILAPAGQKIYVVRPAGKGRINFNVKPSGCTAVCVRDDLKVWYGPDDIGEAICGLMNHVDDHMKEDRPVNDGKEYWALLYGSSFPEKTDEKQRVAPVQPKKESKVSTPKKKQPIKDSLPDDVEKRVSEKVVEEEPENEGTVTDISQIKPNKLDPATIRGYKAGLTSDINILKQRIDSNLWKAARTKCENMISTLNRLIDDQEG